jgi:2C-methyl-D-erythritol 2,4-cyclodiphosphate synthase
MAANFDYWNDLLDGKKPMRFDGKPQCGLYAYYMGKDQPKARVRIDISDDTGDIVCWVNGEVRTDINQVWKNCGGYGVTDVAYEYHEANGRWPDGAPFRPAATQAALQAFSREYGEKGAFRDDMGPTQAGRLLTDSAPPAGGNNPPPEAIHELLPYTFAQVKDWFVKIGAFTSAKHIEEAANQCDGLRKIVNQAKKAHEAEKKPHLDAGREVDRKYLDHLKDADALLKAIAGAVAAFAQAERAKEKIAEEAAAAAKEAQAKEFLASVAGKSVDEQVEALKAAAVLIHNEPAPPPVAKAFTNSMGKGGFKARPKRCAVIEDDRKLYEAVRHKPEVVEFLGTLAQKALDAGDILPGVGVTERIVAGMR